MTFNVNIQYINFCSKMLKVYKITVNSSEAAMPLRGVFRKRCSENMQQIYRGIPMPKFDFNKVAKATLLKPHFAFSNFIKISLRYGCSPINLLHIFRTPFPENITRRLLLIV